MGNATADTTTYYNLIDGDWVPSVSGDLFENRNPANTGDLIGLFQKSTAADVARAIDAARRASEHWRLVLAPKRAELLFRAAQLLADRKEALARDMTREMGKVLDETRGDVQEAIDMTYFMAGEGRRQYGQTVPSELRDKFAMSIRQPVGVSAIIRPVVSVIPCKSYEEAVSIGNGVQYGLSASIYTQDVNRAFAAMRDMYTGIFYVNAPTIGAEVHLPFGGTKSTGNGHREAGTAALDVFSEWKSVYVDFSGKLQRAQIDTAEL